MPVPKYPNICNFYSLYMGYIFCIILYIIYYIDIFDILFIIVKFNVQERIQEFMKGVQGHRKGRSEGIFKLASKQISRGGGGTLNLTHP